MHLKHLSINGFKSFAKKSELEFAASITAIVGPNGSGKSNVAEAFRFVLGEQSPTKMRGKKGEDLIWGGSDQVSRGSRASVEVLLDNQKRIFPVDYDEVKLERVVHRDGQNDYLINGSKVRLKDVQEILSAANIGSTGHHIISQGEADRILSASQKERREMIEDALGLKVYQFKKTEAEKKLSKTKSNIAQVESLRKEVAPHLKFLEKQIKKIEKSLALREDLQLSYAEYLRREEHYLSGTTTSLEQAKLEPKKKLEILRNELAIAKKTLTESEENKDNAELLSVEKELSEIRKEKQQLLRQIGEVEGQLQFIERRLANLKKQKDSSTHQISNSELEKLVLSIEREVENAIKKEEVSLLQRALSDVLHTLKRFINQSSTSKTKDTSTEEEERSGLLKQKTQLASDLQKLERQEAEAEDKYTKIKNTIESDQSQGREAEREIFRIMGEERELESELSQIEQRLLVLRRDEEEFKREVQEGIVLIGKNISNYKNLDLPEGSQSEPREKQQERRRELEKLKIRVEELGGGGEEIEKEYKEVKERDEFLEREISDLESSVSKLESLISELDQQLNSRFLVGIEKISTEFNRFFVLMFGGGEAAIERKKATVKRKDEEEFDSANEELSEESEEGVEIVVKLPNKRVKGLDMLSGGERALTSIALIFAMSQVNPPLFVILDETDAALDEANSRRYGDMIEALSEKSQLILITHNRETMSRAGILYGVTMSGDGVSKLLSVKFDEAVAVAK